MRQSGDFGKATGRHMVALYVECHVAVYGVEPVEITDGLTWHGAVASAQRMLDKDFGGDVEAMLDFVRWLWARERRIEKRRRSDGDTTGRRIGWRLMFCVRSVLTDYRVACERSGG